MSHSEPNNHGMMIDGSHWPIIGSIGLFFIAIGVITWLHGSWFGPISLCIGALIFGYMLFGWFGAVIHDNQIGLSKTPEANRSYRWGMFWFIFTEVMFFSAIFAAFFYARFLSVPWLGGYSSGDLTHYLLWPAFQASWPLTQVPDATQYTAMKGSLDAWGIPALNTLILFTSDMIITWGFWELLRNNRGRLLFAQFLTIVLSIIFLLLQIREYGDAYTNHALTLTAGIYGATFYMLTGVHGLHVVVGIIMVAVMMWRTLKGHFTPQNNFGIAALTWYWHFIDALWFIMFIFVYWW